MAHAYTPGLHITAETKITKVRMLPLPGRVLVNEGDIVKSDQVVAETDFPGDVVSINVVNQLGIEPSEINEFMMKKEGDAVEENEPIAENKPLIKWFKTVINSPITGTIENISNKTGQVLLRKPPRKIELLAYIDSKVVEVLPETGVVIKSAAAFVQGIIGIGGERTGELVKATKTPNEILSADLIKPEHKGKILFGGSLIKSGRFEKKPLNSVSVV